MPNCSPSCYATGPYTIGQLTFFKSLIVLNSLRANFDFQNFKLNVADKKLKAVPGGNPIKVILFKKKNKLIFNSFSVHNFGVD